MICFFVSCFHSCGLPLQSLSLFLSLTLCHHFSISPLVSLYYTSLFPTLSLCLSLFCSISLSVSLSISSFPSLCILPTATLLFIPLSICLHLLPSLSWISRFLLSLYSLSINWRRMCIALSHFRHFPFIGLLVWAGGSCHCLSHAGSRHSTRTYNPSTQHWKQFVITHPISTN